jgi:GT2 family glycosyltransferase
MEKVLIFFKRIFWVLRLLTALSTKERYKILIYYLCYILYPKHKFIAEIIDKLSIRKSTLSFIPCIPESKHNKFGVPESSELGFQMWLWRNYPQRYHLNCMMESWKRFSYQPRISVILPIYSPKLEFLVHAIESILEQTYPNWQLCICTDGPQHESVHETLLAYSKLDPRIITEFRQERKHISATSNAAIQMVRGEFVALLDQDDIYSPHALHEVVKYLNNNRDVDFLYSDEAKIDEEGKFCLPFHKPDWSPDYFNSIMYVCHLLVFRKDLLDKISGFREGFEGSQDWDLVLRASEMTSKIGHISDILYYWRIHEGSTAKECSNSKTYAKKAALKAITEAIERRDEIGVVSPAPRTSSGCYEVRYKIKKSGKTSVIIPFRDHPKILDRCLHSISNSNLQYPFEIILVDNESKNKEIPQVIDKWSQYFGNKLRFIPFAGDFNYARLHNCIVPQSSGEYVVFLNNDTEILSKDWINSLLEFAQKPRIGAVGAKLLYPDMTIQHAGVILGLGGAASHSHRGLSVHHQDYYNRARLIGNFSSICAACMMCRREVFDEVGGFNEAYSHNFNDVDFCLKLVNQGYSNVYLPHVELIHHESKTRGKELSIHEKERFHFEYTLLRQNWLPLIENDPFYNKHLSKEFEDFRLKHPKDYKPLLENIQSF